MSYLIETVVNEPETQEDKPSHVRAMLSFRDFTKELVAGVNDAKKHDSGVTLLLVGIKDQPDPVNKGDLVTLTQELLNSLDTTSVVGPADKDQFAAILRRVDIMSAIPTAIGLSDKIRSTLSRNLPISLAFLTNQDDIAGNIHTRAALGLQAAENDPNKGIVIADSRGRRLYEEDLPEDVRGRVTLEHI